MVNPEIIVMYGWDVPNILWNRYLNIYHKKLRYHDIPPVLPTADDVFYYGSRFFYNIERGRTFLIPKFEPTYSSG